MEGGIRSYGLKNLAILVGLLLTLFIPTSYAANIATLDLLKGNTSDECHRPLLSPEELEALAQADKDLLNLALAQSEEYVNHKIVTRALPHPDKEIENELIDIVIQGGVNNIQKVIERIVRHYVHMANVQTDIKWSRLNGIRKWINDDATYVSEDKSSHRDLEPPIVLDKNGVFPRVREGLLAKYVISHPRDLHHFKGVPLSDLDTFKNPQMRQYATMALKKNLENVIGGIDKKLELLERNLDELNLTKFYEFKHGKDDHEGYDTLRLRYLDYINNLYLADPPGVAAEDQILHFHAAVTVMHARYTQLINEVVQEDKRKNYHSKVTLPLSPIASPKELEKKTNEVMGQTVIKNMLKQLSEAGRFWTSQSLENYTNGDGTDLNLIGKNLRGFLFDTWDELREHVNLSFLENQRPKEYHRINEKVEEELHFYNKPENIFPLPKNGKDKNPEVKFNSPKLAARYSPEISTMLLNSPQQVFPIKKAPLISLLHGYGTNQSKSKSYGNSLAKMEVVGRYNIIAHDMPVAGMGLDLEDTNPIHAATYAEKVSQYLVKQQIEQQGKFLPVINGAPYAPRIAVGRSAGSTIQDIHSYFYPESDYDIRLSTAFSNPITINEQLEHVKHEVEIGIINNLDEKALDYFFDVSLNFLDILRKSSPQKREIINLESLTRVYVVGKADEDGGITVIEDNETYLKEFFPLSHRWYLRDPLEGTSYTDESDPKFIAHFNFLEARHNLINPHENVAYSLARVKFSDVPMELWPKLENQLVEIMAVSYATMDHVILLGDLFSQAHSTDESINETFKFLYEKSQKLKAYRDFFLDGEKSKTFLDWYIRERKLDPEDVLNGNPREFFGQQSQIRKEFINYEKTGEPVRTESGLSAAEYQKQDMTNRLTKIQRYFFKSEPRRIKKDFQKKGYLQ